MKRIGGSKAIVFESQNGLIFWSEIVDFTRVKCYD